MCVNRNNRMDICMDKVSMRIKYLFRSDEHGHLHGHNVHVFAFRWEKNGKSGYMPAYSFDPYMYKLHQMKGKPVNNTKHLQMNKFSNTF